MVVSGYGIRDPNYRLVLDFGKPSLFGVMSTRTGHHCADVGIESPVSTNVKNGNNIEIGIPAGEESCRPPEELLPIASWLGILSYERDCNNFGIYVSIWRCR
jgi:hypothetical protein